MTSSGVATNKKLLKLFNSISDYVLKFLSSKVFLCIIFIWFFIQAFYLVFSTRVGLPPDENYHLEFIRLFTENGWLPFIGSQEGHYTLGEAVRTPFFLYHYLLSLPNHIWGTSEQSVFFLRIINVLLGAGSIFLTYQLARTIKLPPVIRNLSIFMLSNTLMFVFLSSSVNYDNLFIFLSLGSVLLLLLIYQKLTLFRAQLLAICLLAGMLTKINFLPIALIVLVLAVWRIVKIRSEVAVALRASMDSAKRLNIALGVLLLLILGLFIQRYAVNLVRYDNYAPRCPQVLSLEQCRQNAVFARDERLDNMVRPAATKKIPEYILGWSLLMGERTYGIFAHKVVEPIQPVKVGVIIFAALGGFALAVKYHTPNNYLRLLLLIVAVYTTVLLFDNYARYQRYGSFTFAVQGRYIFAVLPLMYLIANGYIWKLINQKALRFIYVLSILVVFAVAGLPSYIYQTGANWHNSSMAGINRGLKSIFGK